MEGDASQTSSFCQVKVVALPSAPATLNYKIHFLLLPRLFYFVLANEMLAFAYLHVQILSKDWFLSANLL